MLNFWPFNKKQTQCTETVRQNLFADNDDKEQLPIEDRIILGQRASLEILRERVKHVERLSAGLEAIKDKQNEDSLDSEAKDLDKKRENPVPVQAADENKKVEELISKIEVNQRVIQSVQDIVQALCLKVNHRLPKDTFWKR